MSEPFTLTVPTDPRYRVLGPEVASKYAELAGGSETDGAGLADVLNDALAEVSKEAAPGAHVDLAFQPTSDGIEVRLTCGTHSSVLRHRIPARKS
jgi:hypothetical protein